MDDDTVEFLQSLERENGGPIQFKTYAVITGFRGYSPVPNQLPVSGLLYIINDRLYFEDFEKQPSVFGIVMPKKKKVYEKYKTSIGIRDITQVSTVSSSAARAASSGKIAVSDVQEVSGLKKLLFQTSVCLKFGSAQAWFMEVLDDRQLSAAVNRARQELG
jgi:hypothetical protein